MPGPGWWPPRLPPRKSSPCATSTICRNKLAACEGELSQGDENRENCLIRLARLSFTLESSPKDEKSKFFEKGRYYSQLLAY